MLSRNCLRERGKELVGIAGGVDTAVWNPATDAHLASRFDPMEDFAECYRYLLREKCLFN